MATIISLTEYLMDTCKRFPEKIAVVDAEEELTFQELSERAFSISNRIIVKVARKNQPIVLFLDKSIGAISSIAGVLMSGNCYCPIDTKSPVDRLRNMLRTLNAELIITTHKYRHRLLEAGMPLERLLFLEDIEVGEISWEAVASQTENLIDTDPAYIIFTSGSTGEPKGVTISHRGVIDYISWARDCYHITEKENIGNQSPLFFDNSTLDIYLSLSTGATLYLIPEMLFQFPVKLLEYIQNQDINFVFWVPSVLVNIANFDLLTKLKLPCLSKVLFAGEVMPAKQLKYWMENIPNALFSNLYGPTEITVDCTYFNIPPDFDSPSVPIGKPCRNSNILILTEDNKEAPIGTQGELCVRGSSLALGYWNNKQKTQEVFCQNPLHSFYNDPIYRTGDIVYQDEEGLIHFVGRKDNQIKHRGYRIELGEIEAAAQQLSKIGTCCAIYNKKRQEIHLLLETIDSTDLKSIQKELAMKLPRYMVPSKYHLLDKMPVTPNGKIDRRSLEAKAALF